MLSIANQRRYRTAFYSQLSLIGLSLVMWLGTYSLNSRMNRLAAGYTNDALFEEASNGTNPDYIEENKEMIVAPGVTT
jgi:hypothetical protein